MAVRQFFEQNDFYQRVPKSHMYCSVPTAVLQAQLEREQAEKKGADPSAAALDTAKAPTVSDAPTAPAPSLAPTQPLAAAPAAPAQPALNSAPTQELTIVSTAQAPQLKVATENDKAPKANDEKAPNATPNAGPTPAPAPASAPAKKGRKKQAKK